MRLKDDETKQFNTFEETMVFFKEQKESDEWSRVFIRDMFLSPIENCPILVDEVMKNNGISKDVSEEAVLETMSGSGLLLTYATKTELKTVPVRSIAFSSLCDRAKLAGSAFPQLSAYDQAKILNTGFRVWKQKALILYRDEKISSVQAGDDKDYAILPVYDLLGKLKEVLERDFQGYILTHAETSHMYTLLSFKLEGQKERLLERINRVLRRAGRDAIPKNAYPILDFLTSDVGMSGANIFPYLLINGYRVRLGDPLRVSHKHGASITDFENNCNAIFSMFTDAAEAFEKMIGIKIKKPVDCFLNVCKKLNLPKRAAEKAVEEFEEIRPIETTAYDIYMALWTLEKYVTIESSDTLINLEENIARGLKLDYTAYDHSYRD